LLNRSTGLVFKSQDVIFEEGTIHLVEQPTPATFDNDILYLNKLSANEANNCSLKKENCTEDTNTKPEVPPLHMTAL